MTQHKKSVWILSGYGIALVLFLYFGLNDLIGSIIGNTFPNPRFMTFLVLIILVTLAMGLSVRHYVSRFTKESSHQLKNSSFAVTIISWLIVLILFSVT